MSAKNVMMSAHALCPSELPHPQRMEWMAEYFLRNYVQGCDEAMTGGERCEEQCLACRHIPIPPPQGDRK